MGCSSSKVDDLPAVALCRERCNFLDEAIRQRYVFSQSHVAYIHSLTAVGRALHGFLEHDFGGLASSTLEIPAPKKGDGEAQSVKIEASDEKVSHSDSGSHLHFQSDSEDEDDDDETDSLSLHHSEHDFHGHYLGENGNQGGFLSNGYVQMHYMKNEPTQSVAYEQRPMSSETFRVSESNGGYYSYPYGMSSFMPYNGYYSYGSYEDPAAAVPESSSKPPPPPPSPPKASAWDFLKLFESYDSNYPPYTPSRASSVLREEEGIPELEDEGFEQEVVKEVQGDEKFVDGVSKRVVEEGEGGKDGEKEVSLGPSSSGDNEGVEIDAPVVDKKVVEDGGKSEDRGETKEPRDAADVVREIEVQFGKAFESGNEIAKLLEVGRLPYKHKHASKILHVATPSLSVVSSQPSTSKSGGASASIDKSGQAYLEIDEDLAMRAKNLSATLHKLYLWEKKLYDEVKAEEKMQVVHERKRQKLKRLDERGAEADKVDSTRTIVRSLSTKIRMAIQVVDKISGTISKIRDEELWPQLSDLIKGLTGMYRCMLDCHRSQCQAIREARSLGPTGSSVKFSDDHLEAVLQLEREIINWTSRFASWISAQKGYVRALNSWLLKCLLYEPEDTPDGIAPFSPGRIGAPPLFVICNQWSQALESISEKEVLDSMCLFANHVLQLWEQDKLEMHQRMMANKDLERRVRFLDREDQKIHKEIQALEKNIVVAAGDGYSLGAPVYQGDTSKNNIHTSLLHVFEAMERFTAESTKAYEELLQRSEEESLRSRE